MKAHNYELTDSVAGFEEGDVLDVTARFGDWHEHALKLEPVDRHRHETIVVTESGAGFSEAEILDPTARIGDWHEYDLAFDPGRSSETADSGRVTLSEEVFEAVAEPVEGPA